MTADNIATQMELNTYKMGVSNDLMRGPDMFNLSHNDKINKLYSEFVTLKSEFEELALARADYAEVFTNNNGETKKRRPVNVYLTAQRKQLWERKMLELKNKILELHKADPVHWPLNSGVFHPVPDTRSDVVKVQMYLNDAVTSRKMTADLLIKRLNRELKSYQRKKETSIYENHIEHIKREIAFFEEHKDKALRLRHDEYTDVLALVYYKNGSNEKIRVSESGLFLSAARGLVGNVKVIPPECKPRPSGQKPSIYDFVSPIETSLPLLGKLYFDDDLIKAREHKRDTRKQYIPIAKRPNKNIETE